MLCSSHVWVRCSPSRLPLDTATRGGFGAVNSAGKEEAWDCRETLLPRAEVPLTLPAGSEVSAWLVLRQVQKAWDLLQQRLSPEPGP